MAENVACNMHCNNRCSNPLVVSMICLVLCRVSHPAEKLWFLHVMQPVICLIVPVNFTDSETQVFLCESHIASFKSTKDGSCMPRLMGPVVRAHQAAMIFDE